MKKPVVLDFDDSVGAIDQAKRIELSSWQDKIRFAASWKNFDALGQLLERELPGEYGPIFMGSGDYHHITYYLLARLKSVIKKQSLTLVVIDNHPDNMRYPFGIHCGSWVSRAAALPFIKHVHVVGITSGDIGLTHAVENRWAPLIHGRLTYWSTRVKVGWAHKIGLKNAFRSFDTIDDLISSFLSAQYRERAPVYLSIDKDALAPSCVRTNWDQGLMETRHIRDLIIHLGPRLIGCDITGDVSLFKYKNRWKRLMSLLDGQQTMTPLELTDWQQDQHKCNLHLLSLLEKFF